MMDALGDGRIGMLAEADLSGRCVEELSPMVFGDLAR